MKNIIKTTITLVVLAACAANADAQIVRSTSVISHEHVISNSWKTISVEYLPLIMTSGKGDWPQGLAVNYSKTQLVMKDGYWEWGAGIQYAFGGDTNFGTIKVPVRFLGALSKSFFIFTGLELRYNLFNSEIHPFEFGWDLGFKIRLKEKFIIGACMYLNWGGLAADVDDPELRNEGDLQLSFGYCF